MSTQTTTTEVVIAGGGLAGIITAYELLTRNKKVLLIDKDVEANFGGLAKKSFGGVCMVGTPHQKRMGIADSPELIWRDWQAFAQFGPEDHWPKAWAEYYCYNGYEDIFRVLDAAGVEFLPMVNWPERGWHGTGNSVPRWHIAWGTGYAIIQQCLAYLERHPKRANLTLWFEHEVSGFLVDGGRVTGVYGKSMRDGSEFTVRAEHTVVASGGVCGGDLSKVREHWYKPWGNPPKVLLNGAHQFGDGLLHDRAAAQVGANVTHLDKQWHYAAGVHHPARARPHDGLSLVPPRSALWLNAHGRRIGPQPLIAYSDTRHLVETILKQPGQYSWQVLNKKIALKELAVSGSDYMTAFRNKNKLKLLQHILFGNHELYERLVRECAEDIVVANSLDELMDKMEAKNLEGLKLDRSGMRSDIAHYDAMIARGPAYHNDEQLRWIANFRTYRGDKIRTCKFQAINDPKAYPLLAIREFILTRKSLGGLQTDLSCRVLRQDGTVIPGLYAVGEAAGFGGGGIHGLRSLEGTFLGGCVLTGRVAGRGVAEA